MQQSYTAEQIRFNAALDAAGLLAKMGYTPEAVYRDGHLIRVFCPIHKDQVRRSLLIDTNERTFRCQYKSCPAHRGGLLVDLFAMYAEVDLSEAIAHLSGKPKVNEETALLAEAERLIEAQQYPEALTFLQRARKLNPTNTITRCRLASLQLEMGDRAGGQAEYLAAAEDFGVKGELDKTLSIYNILIVLSPKDLKVRRQLAHLFSRLGRPADAAEHLKWAVDQYLAQGRIDEAASMCEQMAEATPDEPTVHRLLADILLEHGSIEQAIPAYLRAADLFKARADWSAAMEVVTKALRFVPGHAGMQERRESLRARIVETQERAASGALAAGASADPAEKEFAAWIASLEAEIERPLPALGQLDSVDISPEDARVVLCRSQLEGLNEEKLHSMERFQRELFVEMTRYYEAGLMSKAELRVFKEFYKSFCIAFEQVKRDGGQ